MAGNENMELKAYKRLAQIRSGMLGFIINRSKTLLEFSEEKPDEFKNLLEFIANPKKWDYCGLLSKEEKAELELLEHLTNDNSE